MMTIALYRTLATSQHWLPRTIRSVRRRILQFSLPAPRVLILPFALAFLAIRRVYFFLVRALICEPFFKVQCYSYGRGLRTGVYLHWILGKGRICTGDRVEFDGKCNFKFAARYSDHPTLQVGDGSRIGHGSSFTVGKSIIIGRDCRIATHVTIFDSPGHPSDPEARRAGQPVGDNEVQPVVLGDNVWVGQSAIIFPGVTIGDNSIVAAGSSVMVSVPANVLVAGNPARQVRSLTPK